MVKEKEKKEQERESYTKYEKARIIAARALQLSMNAPILLKLSKEELEQMRYDVTKIAEKEFEAGILPITVIRPLPLKLSLMPEKEEIAEKIEAPTPEEEEKSMEEQERVSETVEEMYMPLASEPEEEVISEEEEVGGEELE
jgi:DNA-directed RNA polymerase subunit K